MQVKNVLVTLPMLESQRKELEALSQGKEATYHFFYQLMDRHLPADFLAEGMVQDSKEIPEKIHGIIGDFPVGKLALYQDTLEFLQIASAGYDVFMVPGVLPKKCVLCNASGAYHNIVAEQLLALTFFAGRRARQTQESQNQHNWVHPGPMVPIFESTTVVIGMGDIGCGYAKRMKALGSYVIGIRKHLKDKPDCFDEQYTIEDLEKVLPRADILALIAPGGPETDNMINGSRMDLMKKTSIIVNAGRGSLIDEKALVNHLNQGYFTGVALDVTRQEPLPKESPLWETDRLVITPHTGGTWQREIQEEIFRISKENLLAWMNHSAYTHQIV